MFYFIVITLLTLCGPVVADTILNGDLTQGGIIFGETKPGFEITLDGKPIRVSSEGYFLLGFSSCLLYTSPSPRDAHESRMPSSA